MTAGGAVQDTGRGMGVDPALIERIYEAAAAPNLWPGTLQAAATHVGAFGLCFVHRGPHHAGWVTSERMGEFAAEYVALGWLERDGRVPPIMAEHYPGFRIDSDYWSEQEVRNMPIYRDFLLPRGKQASAACALQGTRDDALHIGVEGLESYATAHRAVPLLNALRPHLARAVSLTAKLSQARLEASVASLDLAGVGAAVVSPDGRLRASNERFGQRLGDRITSRASKVRFADRYLQARFMEALVALTSDTAARSIAIAATAERAALVIHLVPLRRSARDVFGWDGVLLLLAEPANANVPAADLLRLLFDLTPAEARLARQLLEGQTLAQAAAVLNIAEATVRVHLRRVFAKTGVSRQAELVRLLLGLGAPM